MANVVLSFFTFYLYLIVAVGLALAELFTIECIGWINCLGVEADQLSYNHYVAPVNVEAKLPLYSGVNTTARLIFPVGHAEDEFRNKLTIVVTNKANYTATIPIYPVLVS